MNGGHQFLDGGSDSLSHLYKAHTALAQTIMQVDELVLKAHKIDTCRQNGGLDLARFSEFLAGMTSALQEWIPLFEDATIAAVAVTVEDQEQQKRANCIPLQDKKVGGEDEEEKVVGHGNPWSSVHSETLLDAAMQVDGTPSVLKEQTLSDSPLVPWLDRVQFFMLTPMAKQKRAFSPVLLRRCSAKDQESMETLSPPASVSQSSWHTSAECMETIAPPAIDLPLWLSKSSAKEQQSISESLPPSVIVTPSGTQHHNFESPNTMDIATPLPPSVIAMPSSTQHHSFESPNTMDIATPLPPQSLVKRYSNFFGSEEDSADLSPVLVFTPIIKQNQASLHKPAKNEEEEEKQSTEYFTAFSPPQSLATHLSPLEKDPPHSRSSELLLPANQEPASAHHCCFERLSQCVELATPLPPQSLMKRYSQFLYAEEDRAELADSAMLLFTPMLASSPPKTCILMRPNQMEDTVNPRQSFQTPVLLIKSPFRTPGLFLKRAVDDASCEDMDLTSLKKPVRLPMPLESVRRNPSSDMQFSTVRKPRESNKRTPLVDLQLSTVRKPGARLPGEQTLKRELWCRMEEEFASMADVCKSLFTDSLMEAPADARDGREGKPGIENRQRGGLFVPRGLQRRGLKLRK